MVETVDTLPVVMPAGHGPGAPQGSWTHERYAGLPDDGRRYEVIDGVHGHLRRALHVSLQ